MSTKRLFLAVPLPDFIKSTLTAYMEPYKRHHELKKGRWVESKNLHITLHFLGNVQEEHIPKIQEILQNELKSIPAFDLAFTKIAFAPSEKRPHMIWATFEKSLSFAELVERVRSALIEFVENVEEDKREPVAHVTIGRFRDFHNKDNVQFTPLLLPSLRIDTCELIESFITNKGPIYSSLGVYPLCKQRYP